jgi:hypothetical protein
LQGYTLRCGFPHSDIHGSTGARPSPQLFAACHVLHRLLAPRHPPNALHSRLIVLSSLHAYPCPEMTPVSMSDDDPYGPTSHTCRRSLSEISCNRPVQTHMSQSRDLPASPLACFAHTNDGAEGSSRDPPHTLLNPIVGSRISHACGLSCPRKSIFHNVNDVCLLIEDRRRRTNSFFGF